MIRLLVFLGFYLWQVCAWAAPSFLLEQAFLKDPGGALTIDQASDSKFESYQGSLGLGFETGATWIRLKVTKAAPQQGAAPEQAVLRVGPHYLEQIELFTLTQNQWSRQTRGALIEPAGRDNADDLHSFDIEASGAGPTTVYLRVQHQGFLIAYVEMVSKDELPHAVAKRVRGFSMSIMMALALLVLGLAFYVTDRSPLLLIYCSFQLTIVLFIASNAGGLVKLFPAASLDALSRLNGLIYVLRVAMTACLPWALLQAHKPSRLYVRGAQLMLVMSAVNALLLLSGHMQLALRSCLLIFALIPFWQFYGAWTARAMPTQQRYVLMGGSVIYIFMLILGLSLNFTDQSWLPAASPIKQIVDWRLNGFAIGVVFFTVTMLEHAAQKKARAQEVESLRQQAVQARSRQVELDERSALIDMLTHELKNPLGTVRFALASLKQQVQGHKDWLMRIQSIDVSARRMDELIERVANFSKIERITATDNPATLEPAALVQELLSDVSRPEQWEVEVEPGASFCCDRQLLMVILENLITNASKYALREHPIRIRVSLDQELSFATATDSSKTAPHRFSRLDISNHVDPECVPDELRLFERYYRHPNAQAQPGMGLGLSVVKTAAQKIGAQVAYRHAHGQVFFTLRVPA